MYIVDLKYRKSIDEIEFYLEEHRQFLDEQYARKVFLASGPKKPRHGGVILVSGNISRSELRSILEKDPFYYNDIAIYSITEFTPLKFDPAFSEIL